MGKKRILLLILLAWVSVYGVFALDFPYNKNLSLASDVTTALAMATPGLFVFEAPASDYLEIVGSYGVTMASAYGVRTLLKETIESPRPYVNESPLPEDVDPSESYDSFPSGHTLMAFASAAYIQTLTHFWYPESKVMKAASIAGWSLATTTAILRVVSGNHYPKDVLAGAAIGGVIGFLGPYLTNRLFPHESEKFQIISGEMIGLRISL
ncbi:MAG: phosphatase PAP2 family protein [Sphaerochaetaceae bacterium]